MPKALYFKADRSQHLGLWVLVFAFASFGAAGYVVWLFGNLGSDPAVFWSLYVGFLLLFSGFVILPYMRVRYELDEKQIRIRQGFYVGGRIKLQKIRRVFEREGRLFIDDGGAVVPISVKDREEFLTALAALTPNLRRYGQELRAEPEPAMQTQPPSK